MTDDIKVVDLQHHRQSERVKRSKVRNEKDDATLDRTWQSLMNVWMAYAAEVDSRHVPDEFCLSSDPSAVFSVFSEQLIGMAQSLDVKNEDILDTLLGCALVQCEPKGRLFQLINKAHNLLEYGDEDAWEKMLRAMHAEGKLTDEQLAHELSDD